MTLQRRDREQDYFVWRDYLVDGKVVKSPVDIDSLPAGRYPDSFFWKLLFIYQQLPEISTLSGLPGPDQ